MLILLKIIDREIEMIDIRLDPLGMMTAPGLEEMGPETGTEIEIETTVVTEIVTTNVEICDDKVDIVKDRLVQGLVDLTLQVQKIMKTK
jgi:hypothetical protein